MSRLRTTALAATLACTPAPAVAQTPGLPVSGGGPVPGVEVGAVLGRTPEEGPVGEATAWAGTLALGTRRLGLQVTAGVLDPGDGAAPGAAGGVLGSFRVLAGGVHHPLSVDLVGGYGIYNGPETVWRHAVAGAAFVLTIPTPLVSLRPWLAPRMDWRSTSPTDGGELASAVAGSAGVDLRFFGGLVLRAAWDKIEGADRTIGFGAAYHF